MSRMRFVVWVGLLALLCAAVTEAKDTDDEGAARKLKRAFTSVLHLGKKKQAADSKPTPESDALKKSSKPTPESDALKGSASLAHKKSQASLHAGDTSEADKSGSGKGTMKRTNTLRSLFGTLRGGQSQRHMRPTAQFVVQGTFTKLVSDGAGEIPPFLLAAWHAILEGGRQALLVEGIFRKAGNEVAVQKMQKEIDRGGLTAASDYGPYDALDIAVLLKQFMNNQKTDDGLTGLMGGFKEIYEGKDDYEPKLDEILEKTHILADSQRAKVGRFYIKIARTVAHYQNANKMAENNMALVYPGFMQLDASNPFVFNSYNGVRKVVYALIMELDHPEAAPDAVPYPVPV